MKWLGARFQSNLHRHLGVALLFLLALMIRLAAISVLDALPDKDELQYNQIALNLLAGHGFSMDGISPTNLRPPAYPLFLAGVYAVFGPDYHHALYTQAVLNALLVFPLFWLGLRLSGSVFVGLLAAALFTVHTSFEIVGILYSENLAIIVAMGFILANYQMIRHSSNGYALLSGALAGIMGLIKPEYALLGVAVFALAMIRRALRIHWRRLAIAAAISLIVFGAWPLRNAVLPGLERSSLGSQTVIGAYYPALSGSWWWPVTDMEALERVRDEARAFIYSRPLELSRQEIIQAVIHEPLGLLKLVSSRVLILWASPPVGSMMLASVNDCLRWLALLGQYLFVGCAFWMLIKESKERPELLAFVSVALYMTIFYGFLHAIRRYGYPFVPELCLFAALFVGHYLRHGRSVSACSPMDSRPVNSGGGL